MADVFPTISADLGEWIAAQHATAPLAAGGRVNCSPKGMDTFRLLGPCDVAYLDVTGSGVETIAHVQENGRSVLMFCAFEGAPWIVRLHGTGQVLLPGSPRYDFNEPRDTLIRWTEKKGDAGIAAYRAEKNVVSLDGLPGLTASPFE